MGNINFKLSNSFLSFLSFLGKRSEFDFQTYDDTKRKNPRLAKVIRGSMADRMIQLKLKELNKKKAAICVMINQGDGKGRKSANVVKVVAVWVDLDGADPSPVKKAKLKPQIVVKTSEGRYQAYWLVSDCPLEDFSKVQAALAKKYNGDPSVTDLCRVMRVPGFYHNKGEPFLVDIAKDDSHLPPYAIQDLISGLELEIESDESVERKPRSDDRIDSKIKEINAALPFISAHLRKDWLETGMAIHSEYPDERGYTLWTDWSKQSPKFNESDQRKTWDSFSQGKGMTRASLFDKAMQNGWQNGKSSTTGLDKVAILNPSYPLTDMGNAKRLAHRLQSAYRYIPEQRAWIKWNGHSWDYVDAANIMQEAQLTVLEIDMEATESNDFEKQRALREHAKRSQQAPRLKAMIDLAEHEQDIRLSVVALDNDPMLLGVENCVIDLRTGSPREPKPNDFVTKQANVKFDAQADCPLWTKFNLQIAQNDKSLVSYIQKLAGYTLTGSTVEHSLFYIYGPGRNGKGVFTHTMQSLLGIYAHQTSNELLIAHKATSFGATPELAAVQGKRMVCVSEVPKGRRFNEALVKQMTGGDKIMARSLYKDPIEFVPNFKIWISGNYLLEVDANDAAMWSRIRAIPFNATFLGQNQDKELEQKLIAEKAGILNWALEGCLKWQEEGLEPPNAVKAANKTYKHEMDIVGKRPTASPGQTLLKGAGDAFYVRDLG